MFSSCIHQHRMWKAMEAMQPLVEKLNEGWMFDLINPHNEVRRLMNKMYLCFSKCLDYQDRLTVKIENEM